MKYYLQKYVTNTAGQDADPVVEIIKDADAKKAFERATTRYHQILAPLHNADDVLYAIVQIQDEYGRVVGDYTETVDHKPDPVLYIVITDADATAEEGVTYYVFINNQYVADTGVSVGDRVYGKYVVAE